MTEKFNSDYKDTVVAKRFLKKYNLASLLFSTGIFILIISIIPYLLIKNDNFNERIIPSLVVAAAGIVLIVIGSLRKKSIREANKNKYTVAAMDFIGDQKKEIKKFYRRDMIIGILLIILAPIIYFLIHYRSSFLPENMDAYITSILILILAIGVFMIINSTEKSRAYTYILENI